MVGDDEAEFRAFPDWLLDRGDHSVPEVDRPSPVARAVLDKPRPAVGQEEMLSCGLIRHFDLKLTADPPAP